MLEILNAVVSWLRCHDLLSLFLLAVIFNSLRSRVGRWLVGLSAVGLLVPGGVWLLYDVVHLLSPIALNVVLALLILSAVAAAQFLVKRHSLLFAVIFFGLGLLQATLNVNNLLHDGKELLPSLLGGVTGLVALLKGLERVQQAMADEPAPTSRARG
jgi:hypothetical protein